MQAPLSPQALDQLSRWVRVTNQTHHDSLELASIWQRQSSGSLNRLFFHLAFMITTLLAMLLLVQGAVTLHYWAIAVGLALIVAELWMAWRVRHWFWRVVLKVDQDNLTLGWKGPGCPGATAIPMQGIQRLEYRTDDGHLSGLRVIHTEGRIALPYTGNDDLDKLFYNLLKHLLSKRKADIRFGEQQDQSGEH